MSYDNNKAFSENYPKLDRVLIVIGAIAVLAVVILALVIN